VQRCERDLAWVRESARAARFTQLAR
jgi:hypothetical protein